MIDERIKILADKYVRGELKGEQFDNFEIRMNSDDELNTYVEFLKSVVLGSELYGVEEKYRNFNKKLKKERSKKKAFAIIILLLGIGISLLYIVNHKTTSMDSTSSDQIIVPIDTLLVQQDSSVATQQKDSIVMPIDEGNLFEPARDTSSSLKRNNLIYAMQVNQEFKNIQFLDEEIESNSNYMGIENVKWISPEVISKHKGKLEFRWEGNINSDLTLKIFTYATQENEYVIELKSNPTILNEKFAPDLYYWEVGVKNEQALIRGRFLVEK